MIGAPQKLRGEQNSAPNTVWEGLGKAFPGEGIPELN